MDVATTRRSRRPGVPPLGRERVVEEALALLREGGRKSLSTRRLAARLGVQSPALYWHVKDKGELSDLVIEAIFATMRPATPGPYLERLRAIAEEVRRALLPYCDAPLLIAERPTHGPHRVRSTNEVIAAFLEAGFAAPEAARLTAVFCHGVLALISEEVLENERRRAGLPIRREAIVDAISRGEGDSGLAITAAAEFMAIRPEELFEIGLQVLLDGVEVRRTRRAEGRADPLPPNPPFPVDGAT